MDTKFDDQGAAVPFPTEAREFLLSRQDVQPIHPPIQCATKALSPRVKLTERVTEHSLHLVPRLTLRLLMSYIYIYIYIYIYMEHLFLMFLDHTQRRTTVGRTSLDE